MFDFVLFLFDAIKNIAHFTFYLSYSTGKIIVSGLLTCSEVLQKLFTTLWTVLQILNEDLLVFLSDLWQRLILLTGALSNFVIYIGDTFASITNLLKSLIFGTSNAIIFVCQTVADIITKVVTSCTNLIASIKHLVVLFGSGVWFVVTLIPVFVIYVCMMITYYIGRAFEEAKIILQGCATYCITSIYDLVTFITDVPFESLAGLFVCLCIGYVLVKFHILLYRKARIFISFVLNIMSEHFERMKTFLYTRRQVVVETNPPSATESENDSSNSDAEVPVNENGPNRVKNNRVKKLSNNDRLCVICMERNKCILAMPCRHLCTCSECSNTLRNYQHTCPICRQYISYTIHVY